MKRCTACKVVKLPEDFYYGYKPIGKRYRTNKKYPHSKCKECDHIRTTKYAQKNKTELSKKAMTRQRLIRYGLTKEEHNAMVLLQNNVCAICNEPNGKTLHVDHDHKTGRVRGLLCTRCNSGIGFFKDDINYLANAIKYLTSP
jgi:hypothetical protein